MQSVTETKQDVVWALARNIARVGYEDLPCEAVDATKKSVLDTLGVIEAASGTTPGLDSIVGLVTEARGKRESTVLGFGGKVPAWMAAFANGAMAHCLDYDDTTTIGHPSANSVPSGLAVAERVGKVSGKEFITAVTLGNDLFVRLCSSVSLKSGWHPTPLFGVFAAAATAAKLLGLSEEQIVDALGLAFCQAAGTFELRFGIGSDIGGMRDAFPNTGGVLAALLAQKGIRGVRTCFEGKAGLFNTYFGGAYDREALVSGLGKTFRGVEVGFKPWPADGESHSAIGASLTLANKHDIRPGDVAAITVYVGDFTQHLCQPLEARRAPATTLDAKFSIPWGIAVAIARRRATIQDYSVEGLVDPLVLSLAQRVTPRLDERYNRIVGRSPSKVEIMMNDGKVFSEQTNFPYGHPKNPMAWNDIVTKFRDCLSHAANPVPRARIQKVIDTITRLEEAQDVGRIADFLTRV